MKATGSTLYATLLLTLLVISGCSGDDPTDPGDNPADVGTFDVVWKENVVYFDSTQLDALLRIDTADFRYHFNAANPLAAGLKSGDVLVIHGTALRKVSAVSIENGEVAVETDDAFLTDAIESGTIAWDRRLDYERAETPSLTIDGSIVPAQKVVTPSGFTYKAKYGDYSYDIAMDFTGEKASVSIKITETAGLGIGTEYKLEGTLEEFRSASDIRFAEGEVSSVEHTNRNLKGTLTASMKVKQQTKDYGFKVPVVLLKYPFLVGPIPVVLNVRMEWGVSATIPLGGEANVAAKFSFDSETGFSYDGIELKAKGQAGAWDVTTEEAQTGAVGATAVEFAIGYPQVECDIFFKTFVPYARTTFLVRGDYSVSGLGGQSCQTAKATFAGVAGAKLSALGIGSFGEKQIQLWAYDKELLRMGECD